MSPVFATGDGDVGGLLNFLHFLGGLFLDFKVTVWVPVLSPKKGIFLETEK